MTIAQLLHLADVSLLPNVTFQITPTSAGVYEGLRGPFTVLRFPPDTIGDLGGSENTACVEVAFASRTSPAVAVRDSKDPSGPHLTVAPTSWRGFLTSVTRTE